MADDEMREKEAADDLDPAFDSIDATMRNVPPKEVTVTPEALAQIVNEAVAKAISAYQQSLSETGEATAPTGGEPAAAAQTRRSKIDQLKGDLGIDEIVFEGPRPEPVEKKIQRELSSQMGVHDFEFEQAPGVPAAPDAPSRTEADAVAGWATRADAIAGWVTPVPPATPPAPPAAREVNDTPAPAAAEEKAADAETDFDWIAAEMEQLEIEPVAAPPEPVVEPAPPPAPKPVARAIPEPVARAMPEPVAPVIEEPPVAPKQDVRETLGSLASWFRSVLGDQSPEREPGAAAPVPEPETPKGAASPAPESPAAPPVSARREEPAPPAAPKPMTPEDAVRFTFDPIPPVPPRLPRDPEQPPKKIKKSGTFL